MRRPLNILSVIHYPVYGGPHNRNAFVAEYLAKEGTANTLVVLPEEPGNAADILRSRGNPVEVIGLHRLRASREVGLHLGYLASAPHEVSHLRAIIRRRDIDVVLVNGMVNPHAAIAGRLEHRGVVWQLLDTFSPMVLRGAIMPLVTRYADCVMTSGWAVADAHPGARAFGDRLLSFYPGVDSEAFRPDEARRLAARRNLGFSEEDLVIGNVSNLNPMKGHSTFVKAAVLMKKLRPKTKFVILGASYEHRPTYRHELEQLAEDGGLVVGRDLIIKDPKRAIPELASAFDVFWLTSEPRSEGLSTVTGEAMALGLPVVAARVGALHETVLDGTTGFLVAPRDPEELAAKTLPLVDLPGLRKHFGSAGRARALECFDIGVGARIHLQAYRLAAARRGRVGPPAPVGTMP